MTKDVNENDIVLGLKCVANDDEILCKDCAFLDNNRGFACRKNVSRAAINLINRLTAENLELQGNLKFVRGTVERLLETSDKQQAEIERLNHIRAELSREIERLKEAYAVYEETTGLKQVRADTAKKFAEWLKVRKYKSSEWSHGEHPYVVEESDIDEVLEEMTEETP